MALINEVVFDNTVVLATLLAVLEITTVQDAANAVGLTPEDLIAEAEAWKAAESMESSEN
jgi:1,6-anhydro-N-acetylmuramate kinase